MRSGIGDFGRIVGNPEATLSGMKPHK